MLDGTHFSARSRLAKDLASLESSPTRLSSLATLGTAPAHTRVIPFALASRKDLRKIFPAEASMPYTCEIYATTEREI